MSLPQIAQEALRIIQQNAAGIGTTADLITLGTAAANVVVQMFKSGKWLSTFLISAKQAGGSEEDQPAATGERHVAILVDINRRMLQDVAAYLDRQGIEADLVVVTNDENYGPAPKFLDPQKPEEWTEMVREFSDTMNRIKREIGGARTHFFISAPMPIAFGIGAVWGTVDEATVYHWEKNDYHPVLAVSRGLRR